MGGALSISSDLVSRPLLARLLRLVEASEDGITANEAANIMGKHLASVYNGLRELEKRQLVGLKQSEDKRETIFIIQSDPMRRRARLILQELSKAKFFDHPQLTNYIMSDLEERIFRALDKGLPDAKVSRQREKHDPDIVIQHGKSSYGVEIDIGRNWPSREDRIYGMILRALGSGRFKTLFLIILGEIEREDPKSVSERMSKIENLETILIPEINVFELLPDDKKWNSIIHERIARTIATRL